ncbi:hypothetical protein F5Y11DRAFT_350097 [Daldinia sp. FL1419]|nr:hypothetical protein F5Y11DRAFT_350097 [Daldinia sp. FL1419]
MEGIVSPKGEACRGNPTLWVAKRLDLQSRDTRVPGGTVPMVFSMKSAYAWRATQEYFPLAAFRLHSAATGTRVSDSREPRTRPVRDSGLRRRQLVGAGYDNARVGQPPSFQLQPESHK